MNAWDVCRAHAHDCAPPLSCAAHLCGLPARPANSGDDADGLPVNLLVLRVDGSTEELVVDMTPRDRKLDILLGAKGLTFLGQYDDLGVVVITEGSAAPLSTHILPFPPTRRSSVGILCS